MSADAVKKAWLRIEAWLSANAPELRAALRSGASNEEIAYAEAATGCTLPAEFAASVRIHDGQEPDAFEVFGQWNLLSLERVVEKWAMLDGLVAEGVISVEDASDIVTEGPVRPQWWDRRWVPVAGNPAGDNLCLDLNPAEGGQPGQIVTYVHDDCRRSTIAVSFVAWLIRMADDLEGGLYEVVTDGSRLRRSSHPG